MAKITTNNLTYIDQHPVVELDFETRNFKGLSGYVVAVVGDSNSQIITIRTKPEYDNIDLLGTECNLIYWTSWTDDSNPPHHSSGKVILEPQETKIGDQTFLEYVWILDKNQTAKAGECLFKIVYTMELEDGSGENYQWSSHTGSFVIDGTEIDEEMGYIAPMIEGYTKQEVNKLFLKKEDSAVQKTETNDVVFGEVKAGIKGFKVDSFDYISEKVYPVIVNAELNDEAKPVITDKFSPENWNIDDHCYLQKNDIIYDLGRIVKIKNPESISMGNFLLFEITTEHFFDYNLDADNMYIFNVDKQYVGNVDISSYSIVGGNGSAAYGNYSNVFGQNCFGFGEASSVSGINCKTMAKGAEAGGIDSIAKAEYSIAKGTGSVTGTRGIEIEGLTENGDGVVISSKISKDDIQSLIPDLIGDYASIYAHNKNGSTDTNLDLFGTLSFVDSSTRTLYFNLTNGKLTDKVDLNGEGPYYIWFTKDVDFGNIDLGYGAHATGINTKALQYGANASGCDTTASGRYSTVSGRGSIAGYNADAGGKDTLAIGQYSFTRGLTTKAYASGAVAFGVRAEALGTCSFSMGVETKANGVYSAVFGAWTEAADYSFSVGQNNKVKGTHSISAGWDNVLNDNFNVGFGKGVQTSGLYACAIGYAAKALDQGCIALGMGCQAGVKNDDKTLGSMALGRYCKALGWATIAIGSGATANGDESFALGANAITNIRDSYAIGKSVIAYKRYQTAMGKFNAERDALFVIGNGTADTVRSNAFEVFNDGHAELQTQGTTENSITTRGYVDGLIQRLEQRLANLEQPASNSKWG